MYGSLSLSQSIAAIEDASLIVELRFKAEYDDCVCFFSLFLSQDE